MGRYYLALALAAGWAMGCSSPEEPAIAGRTRTLPDTQGNATAGREIFFRKASPKCFICHAIGADKEKAGPNLQDVGTRYDRGELLDALLHPSRQIADGFSVQIIETQSQGLVVGVVARETPSLLIRNELGDEIAVSLDQVLSRRTSERSMMPDDLIDSLSDQDLLDLLAFLESLAGEPAR
ncbi:MAG: c-type cytochrome [Acidobacteria bacterium]|nr:c-type cytochrome [Acidobacteriota bacterium]